MQNHQKVYLAKGSEEAFLFAEAYEMLPEILNLLIFGDLSMKTFEQGMWSLRWVMLLTVLAVMSGALLLVGFVLYDFFHLFEVVLGKGVGLDARTELLMILIEIIDQALMAGVMLMFGFGIYEIFISKIDIKGPSGHRPKLLVIDSIDQLKRKLGAMVIMMLIVKFLSLSTKMEISSAIDLLMFAA